MVEYQVPRLALVWLLFTQTLLLMPHLLAFPAILVPIWLLSTVWRIMIYRARWSYPPAWIKALLIGLACVLLLIVQKPLFSVETAILALLIAFLLKLLEMKQRRDVLVIIYLAYFVIVTELLLSQNLIAGMYLLTGLLLVTTTLIAVQSSYEETAWQYPLLQAARMLVLSLPVMLVAFLVFPRLEPLWTVPMPSGSGKTGVSGSMSPGTFAQLAKSDALAFRVKFSGDVPALKDLYWRGVVLSQFDGKTWLPLEERAFNQPPLEDIVQHQDGKILSYRIIMEPSYQPWVFPLVGVIAANPAVSFLRDLTIRHQDIIDQRQAWDIKSYSEATLGEEIYRYQRRSALQLPKGFNPETLAFAQSLRTQSSSSADYIDKVLDYFRHQAFYYTLSPPLLGKHTVDDFLFRSRRGFCEHYASAFVVLMRAADIPSRVIAGYQGGDINPYEKNVTVRQLDAHAWAEVWLPKKGWVKVDPTYAVAPERIEQGGQESLQKEEQFLADSPFSPMHYGDAGWLKSLQYRFDQANFLWYDWVMNYRGNQQQSVLLALLGSTSPQAIAWLVLSVFMAFSVAVGIFIAWHYRPLALSPVERQYRYLLKKMARKGLRKNVGEGASDFAVKAKARWPDAAADIDEAIQQYIQLNYACWPDKAEEARLLKQFKRVVIRLKLR